MTLLLSGNKVNNRQKIESKSNRLWGKDLHKDNSVPAHCTQLENIFKQKWRDSLKGDLLEIGCGSGADLEIFSKLKEIKTITAIDLGENIEKLAERYKERKDIDIRRGNALSLDLDGKKSLKSYIALEFCDNLVGDFLLKDHFSDKVCRFFFKQISRKHFFSFNDIF